MEDTKSLIVYGQTKRDKKKRHLVGNVMCYMSGVRCSVLRVTCHLSLKPTATATDPPSAKSPNMHSRLGGQDPKLEKKF